MAVVTSFVALEVVGVVAVVEVEVEVEVEAVVEETQTLTPTARKSQLEI